MDSYIYVDIWFVDYIYDLDIVIAILNVIGNNWLIT